MGPSLALERGQKNPVVFEQDGPPPYFFQVLEHILTVFEQ